MSGGPDDTATGRYAVLVHAGSPGQRVALRTDSLRCAHLHAQQICHAYARDGAQEGPAVDVMRAIDGDSDTQYFHL